MASLQRLWLTKELDDRLYHAFTPQNYFHNLSRRQSYLECYDSFLIKIIFPFFGKWGKILKAKHRKYKIFLRNKQKLTQCHSYPRFLEQPATHGWEILVLPSQFWNMFDDMCICYWSSGAEKGLDYHIDFLTFSGSRSHQ